MMYFFFTEDNTVDHEKLLQTIQTDKTTISRAMAQNKQLKDQLTELQDGFIKMVGELNECINTCFIYFLI